MRYFGAILAWVIAILIAGGVIVAEYTNVIPCGVYSHSPVKEIPARCLSHFNK